MNLVNFFFSPTGGTLKAVELLDKELGLPSTMYDLTSPLDEVRLDQNSLALFAVPSFAGRCPQLALDNLKKVKGNGTKAIIVTTYGNRAFDDTLIELKDNVESLGFVPVAALALVTQHSIFPMFASRRPNKSDELWIKIATGQIKAKLETDNTDLQVPGKRPYKAIGPNPLKPIVETEKCTKCGLCAEKCPTHAIDKAHPNTTEIAKCISCMRCLSLCPSKARYLDSETYNAVYNKLLPALKEIKKNLLFL